jgi:hypothetical protein
VAVEELDGVRPSGFTGIIMINLTARQLRRAAGIKDKIALLETELATLLETRSEASVSPKRLKGRTAAKAQLATLRRARRATGRKASNARLGRRPGDAARKRLARRARIRWARALAAGKRSL